MYLATVHDPHIVANRLITNTGSDTTIASSLTVCSGWDAAMSTEPDANSITQLPQIKITHLCMMLSQPVTGDTKLVPYAYGDIGAVHASTAFISIDLVASLTVCNDST